MYHLQEASQADETIDIIDSSIDQIELFYNNSIESSKQFSEMMEKVNSILFANGLKISDINSDDFDEIYNDVKDIVDDEVRLEFQIFGLMDVDYSDETNLLLVIRVGKEHVEEPLQFDINMEYAEEGEDYDEEDDEPFSQVNRPYDLMPGIDS